MRKPKSKPSAPIRSTHGAAGAGEVWVKCACRAIVAVPESGAVVTCIGCRQRWQWQAERKARREVVITEWPSVATK